MPDSTCSNRVLFLSYLKPVVMESLPNLIPFHLR